MSSGQMREQVSFRRSTRTQRTDGGYDSTVSSLSTVWASVVPVAANEREQTGRLLGATTYLVTIYADDRPSTLTTDDALRWETAPGGALDGNIRAIRLPPERPLTLEIVCEMAVNL